MHLFLVLGNQLFPSSKIKENFSAKEKITVFIREDKELCEYFSFHKIKITFFLSSMRAYADELRQESMSVHYEEFGHNKDLTYEQSLEKFIIENQIKNVSFFEIEDHFFESRIHQCLENLNVSINVLESPMFFTPRSAFKDYLKSQKKPFMKKFYELQRKKFDILMEDNKPLGGQWSYDTENRKALPKSMHPPKPTLPTPKKHVSDVQTLVQKYFASHPGNEQNFWLPTTRKDAHDWLQTFFKERFCSFGPYEDALAAHSDFVYHSVLAPLLNIGLLTPKEVIDKSISYSQDNNVPLQSLEGFIRQIIGWREFIRGMYQNYGEKQKEMNFWNHDKKLSKLWYQGNTGVPILDRILLKVLDTGYLHHIERLMVVGNLMTLLEIHPKEAYRWFMEMFVDSSDWVMVPNVYGMALFADGGSFATKPYICGSNYWLKMSGEKSAPWCDGIDGLYWSFIEKHKDFFSKNPRTSLAVSLLKKIPTERLQYLKSEAQKLKDKLVV